MATKRTKSTQTAKPTQAGGASQPRRRKPSRAAIAERSQQLYQADGGGDPTRHWLQAECELQGG